MNSISRLWQSTVYICCVLNLSCPKYDVICFAVLVIMYNHFFICCLGHKPKYFLTICFISLPGAYIYLSFRLTSKNMAEHPSVHHPSIVFRLSYGWTYWCQNQGRFFLCWSHCSRVFVSVEGALKGGVGVSTLIYASAKSVNCCSCGVVENLWAYTSRFRGE